MQLIRINEKNELFEQAYSLYETEFCREERRDREGLMHVLKNDDYHFCILWDKRFVGIMLYWDFDSIVYLDHFSICPELRGHGYGTQAISLLRLLGKRIVLEIEPPDEPHKVRRKNFYLRNGFILNEHEHFQPRFHRDDADIRLLIMSTDGVLSGEEYRRFRYRLIKEVEIASYIDAKRVGDRAEKCFRQGYNCCQAVLCAFLEEPEIRRLGVDDGMLLSMASSFGGGMGRLREVCGAFSAIIALCGVVEGYSEPETGTKKAEHYARVQELARRFKNVRGTIICRELLELPDGADDPNPTARTEEYYRKRPCPGIVRDAARTLAEFLNERVTDE